MSLAAETCISHPRAAAIMEHFSAEHGEYEVEPGRDGHWEFRTPYGSMIAEMTAAGLGIRVDAPDETCLSYLKIGVADHALEYLGEVTEISWRGDGIDSGVPVFFRELRVISAHRVAPDMQRVRFAGRDLDRIAYGGLHVRLLLPPKGRRPVWPSIGSNGSLVWPQGADALTVRIYTIRAIDPQAGWLDIDFVVHADADSPASSFAEVAQGGEIAGLLGPGGGDVPVAKRIILIGDATALPAIARILEAVPRDQLADVVIVAGEESRVALAAGPHVGIRWVEARPIEGSVFVDALGALEPAGPDDDVFVWAAGEHAEFRAVRKFIRTVWKLPREKHLAAAYWRKGIAGEAAVEGAEA